MPDIIYIAYPFENLEKLAEELESNAVVIASVKYSDGEFVKERVEYIKNWSVFIDRMPYGIDPVLDLVLQAYDDFILMEDFLNDPEFIKESAERVVAFLNVSEEEIEDLYKGFYQKEVKNG